MKIKGLNLLIIIISIAIFVVIGIIMFSGNNDNENNQGDFYFSLEANSMELSLGEISSIPYKTNADIDILWTSQDESIVIVDRNGFVKAMGIGSTTVSISYTYNRKKITQTCSITVYSGDKSVALNEIVISEGDLFITVGDKYNLPMEYSPQNAYITKVEYQSSDDNIVKFNGSIEAIKSGRAIVKVIVNGSITKEINVNVIDTKINPTFGKKLDSVSVSNTIDLIVGNKKTIDYQITPTDALIYNQEMTVVNKDIATISNGEITAIKEGSTKIQLVVNDIKKEIALNIKAKGNTPDNPPDNPTTVAVTGLKLSSSKSVELKEGGTSKISVEVLPSNATNKGITYKSSNTNIATVSTSGLITAKKAGSCTITVKASGGNYSQSITVTVKQAYQEIAASKIYGYTDSKAKTPTRAGKNYFSQLAKNGKGVMSGNIYFLTTSNGTYRYDTSSSILMLNNNIIYMRMYYPSGYDLSSVNTFTFLGGTQELGFGGVYSDIESSKSIIKSSGITILVSGDPANKFDSYNGYDYAAAMYATDFVKTIVNQNSSARNTIGGYSAGGRAAGKAFAQGDYNQLIIFSSYFDDFSFSNSKNARIVVYSPLLDDENIYNKTVTMLNRLATKKYSNVVLITNNQTLIDATTYQNRFSVVNVIGKMGTGHAFTNIKKAKVFEYACA